MPKPLVILGTARRDGETRRSVKLAFPDSAIDLTVLTDHLISGYDYGHGNSDDDFLAIAESMARTQAIASRRRYIGTR